MASLIDFDMHNYKKIFMIVYKNFSILSDNFSIFREKNIYTVLKNN